MLTYEEHRQRHQDLHDSFDELVADRMAQTDGSLDSTISDLAGWSKVQTLHPTENRHATPHLPTIKVNRG